MTDPLDEDLSGPPGAWDDEKPAEGQRIIAGRQERMEFRGVGEVRSRTPIAAVVEVARRAPGQNNRWNFVRPFTGIPDGAEYAFNIMQSVPTTSIKRGTKTAPAREVHPAFDIFNSCHPAKARSLRCKVVSWREADFYQYSLGAYSPPPGHEQPKKAWWCRGDANKAQRWVDGALKCITCPGQLCEFQQKKFGPGGKASHCKPNLRIIAQFNWADGADGKPSPMPKVIFELDSKSWNNVANCIGMLDQIHSITSELGYARGDFPLFDLDFSMHLKEKVETNQRYPVIGFSIDCNLKEWIGRVHSLKMYNKQAAIEAPRALAELPPVGFTQEDMDRASEATLDPNYKPANIREISQ